MNAEVLHIDGSQGEGGGQVLRSSLALSMALGRPFRITNIRANRPKPGLMRQHLTAVEAAAAICGATVEGGRAGSRELTFGPGGVRPGVYRFSVGTAGSTTLVLQAVLPALLFAEGPSEITVEGGTHARWAPPFDFLERAVIPVLKRMGTRVTATIERHGFYPAGGGCVRVWVQPGAPVALRLEERGEITRRRVSLVLARLPFDVARREIDRIRERLGWDVDQSCIVQPAGSVSPGNVVTLELGNDGAGDVCCAIGEQGKRAEEVADEAIELARHYIAGGVPVGRYLADQLMVPMAIACVRGAGECAFRTLGLSRHAQTNTAVVRAFVRDRVLVTDDDRPRWSVR